MSEVDNLADGLPQIDLSTPEKTVKSYWKFNEYFNAKREPFFLSEMSYYATEDAISKRRKWFEKFVNFDSKRNIDSVDAIGETTALVYAQELPNNSATEKQKIRFRLEKFGSEWRVELKERQCYLCEGTGTDKLRETGKCALCYATGWIEENLW